jgi:phenylacetate-CoA ligase
MNIAKAVFSIIEKLRREPVFKCLEELEENQWLTGDQINDLQWEALTNLVRHAYANVPYYRQLFDTLHIRPSDIKSPEDFWRIPVLTKEDLRRHSREMLASNRREPLHSAYTSGTTGIPLTFYRDGTSMAYALAAMYRGHRWYGVDVGAREAMLWDEPIGWRARVGAMCKDLLLNRFREKECKLDDDSLRHFYRIMKRKRPEYLMGFPSMIYPFAVLLKEEQLDGKSFGLKMVKCTAETLFDYQAQLVESVFGCHCMQEYGSAEVGVIAFECPERGLHLMNDCVYVEFLDESDRPVSAGENARIVVTNLRNLSMPILRYDQGDMGADSEKTCSCGRGLPLMKSVEGRVCDYIVTAEGRRAHSSVLYHIVKNLADEGHVIKQWRVYQTAIKELEIKIVKGPGFSENALARMNRGLRQYLGPGMDFDYEFVSDIPREKSGKLRNFVPLRTADDG